MEQAWIVRAGRDDEYEQEVLEQRVVAMGWRRLGDLTRYAAHSAINSLVDDAYAEFSYRSRQEYGAQLYAFRSRMRTGDHIVLIRRNAPDLAVGTVTGDYAFRPELPAPHVRPVRWVRTDVSRAEAGADLLAAPALTSIYRITRKDAQHRLVDVIAASRDGRKAAPVHLPPPDQRPVATETARDNLRRNLEYAYSLAAGGQALQDLKVQAFDVTDVYRAAWVQAVAALDHWVHREMRERMLVQVKSGHAAKNHVFRLPPPLAEQVSAGSLTPEAAVDVHWEAKRFGRETFLQPPRIVAGLKNVANVDQLWRWVAEVLTERAGADEKYRVEDVEARQREVVFRRNKIAHEYDEDPDRPPAKRAIDKATTTMAITWIEQLAEAIVVVLDGKR